MKRTEQGGKLTGQRQDRTDPGGKKQDRAKREETGQSQEGS